MIKNRNRDLLIGKKVGDYQVIGIRQDKSFSYVQLNNGLEFAFQAQHKNNSIIDYLTGGHTAFIIGNGPSLMNTDLDKLIGRRSYAANRIWKLWEEKRPQLKWRPTDYVRLEKGGAKQDINKMKDIGCVLHVQRGVSTAKTKSRVDFFATCDSTKHPEWHLPMICGYATVVQAAMQIAVREGANQLVLLGCDLGMPSHFYGEEGIDNDNLAYVAHEIAKKSCPVPIYNATVGGNLDLYPRVVLEDILIQV